MSSKQLIEQLSAQATPKHTLTAKRITCEWLALTIASLTITSWLFGIRDDFFQQLGLFEFQLELAANTILLCVSGYIAIQLAFPTKLTKKTRYLLFFTTIMYVSAIATRTLLIEEDSTTSTHAWHAHNINCLLCILAFALIPAILMLWRLRQLATTHPALLGTLSMLMATSTGALGVLLVENETVTTGLILWHYLPLLIISAIGYAIGKKFFSW